MWKSITPDQNKDKSNIYIMSVYSIDGTCLISISATRDGSLINYRGNISKYVAIIESKNKLYRKYIYGDDLETIKMKSRIIAGNLGWCLW